MAANEFRVLAHSNVDDVVCQVSELRFVTRSVKQVIQNSSGPHLSEVGGMVDELLHIALMSVRGLHFREEPREHHPLGNWPAKE
eukprot:3716976-Amphidinium_carterae.3